MIIDIVNQFEPINQSFRICGEDMQIHPEDVRDMSGI
jgi:hypothetical protein